MTRFGVTSKPTDVEATSVTAEETPRARASAQTQRAVPGTKSRRCIEKMPATSW